MSEINRYGISGGAAVQVASGYFPEGQSPSSLNDASRTVMADVRRYVEQTTPETTATYSGGVYTLSLTRDLSAGELTQGFTAAFIAGSTNSASATFNLFCSSMKLASLLFFAAAVFNFTVCFSCIVFLETFFTDSLK